MINLQQAIQEDLELYLSIWLPSLKPHIEKLHTWKPVAEKEYATSIFRHSTLKRICLNEEIIGFVNLRPADYSSFNLGGFCIKPEYQRKGYGTEVLHQIIQDTDRCIFLNVLTPNINAARLYKRVGFEYSHSDEISDYYRYYKCSG